MNANDLRKKTSDELNNELTNLLKEQFNLRMLHGSDQLRATHQLKNVRRNIACVKTIMTEKLNTEKLTGEANG